MSDLWAYCDPCRRWFYPEGTAAEAVGPATCPVCATEPATLAEEPEPSA